MWADWATTASFEFKDSSTQVPFRYGLPKKAASCGICTMRCALGFQAMPASCQRVRNLAKESAIPCRVFLVSTKGEALVKDR